MHFKETVAQIILSIAVVNMIFQQASDPADCNVNIRHWVFVSWLLMGSKYLSVNDIGDMTPMKLYCGKSFSNPITFYWMVRGIINLAKAQGPKCYQENSQWLVILLVVFGMMSILIFLLGSIMLVAYFLQRVAHRILSRIYGQERVDQMPLFRMNFFINLQMRQVIANPNLSITDIEQLRNKIEKVVSDRDMSNERFVEDPCPICLETFQLEETYIPLKCNHNYHSACLSNWLDKNSSCPMCKDEVRIEDYNHSPREEVNLHDDHTTLELNPARDLTTSATEIRSDA